MEEKKTLQKLLEQLDEHLSTIDQMSFSLDKLLSDIDIQHLLERRMQLSIDTCIDIASHIAAREKLPGRENAADAFLLLGEHNLIDKNLSEKLAKAVGFRNILINEHTKINHRQVYKYYKKDLDNLREFAKQVSGYL